MDDCKEIENLGKKDENIMETIEKKVTVIKENVCQTFETMKTNVLKKIDETNFEVNEKLISF